MQYNLVNDFIVKHHFSSINLESTILQQLAVQPQASIKCTPISQNMQQETCDFASQLIQRPCNLLRCKTPRRVSK